MLKMAAIWHISVSAFFGTLNISEALESEDKGKKLTTFETSCLFAFLIK